MEKSIIRINDSIMNSKIDNHIKEFMLEVVRGIVSSSDNKIYVSKSDDYQEYLALRKSDFDDYLRIAIVRKMIEYSGSVGGRDVKFPSLSELANYLEEHRDTIAATLKGIQYASNNDIDDNTHSLIIKLSAMNLPDYMTSRTMQVLERIINGERVFSVKEDERVEFIILDGDAITVVEKMVDYSGATMGKRRFTIALSDLLDYVELHHVTIDKSLNKGKSF